MIGTKSSMAGWIGFVVAQLGFLGNSQYPLWALTALALNVVVLYALTARWKESQRREHVGDLAGLVAVRPRASPDVSTATG
jgi:ammonia channel protein AmtB